SERTGDCRSAPWARSSSTATWTPADGCEIAFPLSKCGWPFAGSRSGCGVATAVSPKKRLAIARVVATENVSTVLCLTADSPSKNRDAHGDYAGFGRSDAGDAEL